MKKWENNESLDDLFSKCKEESKSDNFCVLILSQKFIDPKKSSDPLETEKFPYHDVICNFFPTEESRLNSDKVKLFSLELETRFKTPETAVIAYLMEYIMTAYQKNETPHVDIYVVTSLGDAKTIVRRNISKTRAKREKDLGLVRNMLLNVFNIKTIEMENNHPYYTTAYELSKQKKALTGAKG